MQGYTRCRNSHKWNLLDIDRDSQLNRNFSCRYLIKRQNNFICVWFYEYFKLTDKI